MPYSEPMLGGLTTPTQRGKSGKALPFIAVTFGRQCHHSQSPSSPSSTAPPLSPAGMSWSAESATSPRQPPALAMTGSSVVSGSARTPAVQLDLVEAAADVAEASKEDKDKEHVLLRQAEHWRLLCLDAESALAQSKDEESRLQTQLGEALERERNLAAKNIELRLAGPPATPSAKELRAATVSQKLERQLEEIRVRDCEIEALRGKLTDMQHQQERSELEKLRSDRRKAVSQETQIASLELELATLQQKLREALKDSELKAELLAAKGQELRLVRTELQEAHDIGRRAAQQSALLSNRCERALRDLSRQQVESATEAAMLNRERDELRNETEQCQQVTMRLRLDLQDSIKRSMEAGALPFYHGDEPNRLDSAAAIREPVVPPKKPDYSRSQASRGQRLIARAPDRTGVTSPHDEQGRLRSFDAQGRAL
eukprot:TRINITY_DN9906_c0_g1_i1.p1 TRINITY_DN9906_c0_g1~~TRINITY_DN9906_c0_g1_i1.p1  ORF type:complete len:457 (+),score=100.51 TRINITY_DN9906_c0_g1_i1:86-1372(+)